MGNVWAIARQTIAESVRMRIAIFFVIVIAVLVLGLPFAARGDSSTSGAVQSFLAYSIAATTFLLSCLTIFLVKSLSSDLADRQILTLMSKPLARWQYVLGKWIGIVALNMVILVVSGGVIYGMTRLLATRPPRDEWDAERLKNQILTARHASKFKVPDFTGEANTVYERQLEQGVYAGIDNLNPDKEKARIRAEIEKRWRSVFPGESREFEFSDVLCRRSRDNMVHLQYEHRVYNYPPDEIIRYQWFFGDPAKDTEQYQVPRRDMRERKHTVPVPADAVASDATFRAVFVNVNPYMSMGEPQYLNTVMFEGDDAVELLFSVGSFGANLVRELALVGCRLLFLAAVAVLAATMFSFPVACLATFTIYALAALRGFLGEALQFMPDEGAVGFLTRSFQYFLHAVYFVIPNFGKVNGLPLLVDGRNVTLKWVLMGVGNLVLIKTTIVLLVACLIFQRREVSEVSV